MKAPSIYSPRSRTVRNASPSGTLMDIPVIAPPALVPRSRTGARAVEQSIVTDLVILMKLIAGGDKQMILSPACVAAFNAVDRVAQGIAALQPVPVPFPAT